MNVPTGQFYTEKMGFGIPGLKGCLVSFVFSFVWDFSCCLGFLHFHCNLLDSQKAKTLYKDDNLAKRPKLT